MMGHRVRPGARVRLGRLDAADTGGRDKEWALERLERDVERLAALQDVLFAEQRHAVLIVLQGMDTAGKDGTIKHVMRGINPSGCNVVPFKVPSAEEAAHDFLWRAHRATPARGHIAIFNRSHYEDVLVPRVHRTVAAAVLDRRYLHINAFERILVENDTLILKFFLHLSRKEQGRRLRERLSDPTKNWKFSQVDVRERARWPRYMAAYEALLSRCSTARAPWYVIPADHKWYRNLAVAAILVRALAGLRPRYPRAALSPARLRQLQRSLR
jgi:PPK2 family polyphosphate:nucleotide phosphotransferase